MAAAAPQVDTKRRTYAILIALGLGVVSGLLLHTLGDSAIYGAEQAGKLMTGLFLRLIKMVIAPLVFATLVSGIGKLGDDTLVLRVGGRILLWFIAMSFVSLTIGLLAANILQPGIGFSPPPITDIASLKHPFQPIDFILHIAPTSILDAMARNDILQIVVFSVLFGLALPAAGKAGKIMLNWTEELGHIMLRMTDMVMLLAPWLSSVRDGQSRQRRRCNAAALRAFSCRILQHHPHSVVRSDRTGFPGAWSAHQGASQGTFSAHYPRLRHGEQ